MLFRSKGPGYGVGGLIHEYSLASEEGVALMCLAEALLRIPDNATRDRLIRDKIGGGDWKSHLGNGRSLLAAAPLIDGPFHILMSDHLFDPEIMRSLRRVPLPAGSARLAVDSNLKNPYVDLDDVTKVLQVDGLITEIGKTIPSYNVFDTGVFYCTPALIAAIEASIAEHNDDSLSGGMRRLARMGKAETMDIGTRTWIDVDDPAAHGLASRLFSLKAV